MGLTAAISARVYDPVTNRLDVTVVWVDDTQPTVLVATESKGFTPGPGVARSVVGWVGDRTAELARNLTAANQMIAQIDQSGLYHPEVI